MNSNNSSSPLSQLIPILLFVAGLIGLYYLYMYLFGPKTDNSYTLISKKQDANIDPVKPIVITSDNLPKLFEGGEFTIMTWIYINNWSYRTGFHKHIISVGGPNFDTIRIYLGAMKPKLSVRLHTRETAVPTSGNVSSTTESLDKVSFTSTFQSLQTDSGLLDDTPICDLPEVELQRWINLTVAVNGKTVDVYMDGKLSRSCVLPNNFKVDAGGYSASLLASGGFGGKISGTYMYDRALNPDVVYKNYMAGPEPILTFSDWFYNFFAPGVSISVTTK